MTQLIISCDEIISIDRCFNKKKTFIEDCSDGLEIITKFIVHKKIKIIDIYKFEMYDNKYYQLTLSGDMVDKYKKIKINIEGRISNLDNEIVYYLYLTNKYTGEII